MSQPATTIDRRLQSTFGITPLPEGWRCVRLDEVCDFLDSRRIPVNNTERVKRIAGKPLSDLFPYYGANGQTGWIDGYLFDEPLILLAEDGGNFGSKDKPIAYSVSGRYWVNNHAHVLRPKGSMIDFDFCLHALRIRPDVAEMVSGSTRAKLNQEIASKIPVPLPPRNEQKRIAAILNEQMAAVERARVAAEAQLKAAKALPAAYMREVFDGAKSKKWQNKKLGELLLNIQAGKSLSCEERPADLQEWGVLKVSAISWGDFQPEENKVLPKDFIAPPEYEVRSDDLLISRANTTELVGATVLVKDTRPKLMLSDKTLRLIPKEDLVLKEYLQLVLRTPEAREFIECNATGTSSSMKNISQEVIRNVPIVLPSMSEQQKIVTGLQKQTFSLKEINKAIKLQLESINKLPVTLLQQAFIGKL